MPQTIYMPQDPRYAAMREALMGSILTMVDAMKQKELRGDTETLFSSLGQQFPDLQPVLQGMQGMKNPQLGIQALPNIIDLIKATAKSKADTGKYNFIQGDENYWKYNDISGEYEKTDIPVNKKDKGLFSDPIKSTGGMFPAGTVYQKGPNGEIKIIIDPSKDKSAEKASEGLNNITKAVNLVLKRWDRGSKGISIGADGSIDMGGGEGAFEEMRKAAADKAHPRHKQAIKDLYDSNQLIDRAKSMMGLGAKEETTAPAGDPDFEYDPKTHKLVPVKR
jgi:hypothetical protein